MDNLYGTETRKAKENFDLNSAVVNLYLIHAMIDVKKAAAITHKELGLMELEKANAIIYACDRAKEKDCEPSFCLNPLQGGAGTSTNMNVNEVIATLATKELQKQVHPLDDVNQGQSTNDVYPTALRIAAIRMVRELSDECRQLQESLQRKEIEYKDIWKLGRTELMDALPITVGQEFGAYAQAIARDRWRIYKVEERLRQVNLGGTAIGTGSNTNRKYTFQVIEVLRKITDIGLSRAEYPIDLTQNNDVFVEVSGLLKALGVNLMKISTDLRWMNSGPNGGLGEITLQEIQAGSTIMPGKVNPVIPEMITQVAIKVMANDQAITMCAANGNFELNAFLPLMADSLLNSLEILIQAVSIFRMKCVETLKVNERACWQHLENSMVLATALTPVIGYEKVAELVKKSEGNAKEFKRLVLSEQLLSEQKLNEILDYRKAGTYL